MNRFIITSGIFEGTSFLGSVKNNRVFNTETIGQSYPIENCLQIGDNVEIIKPFPNLNLTGKTGKVVEFSAFNNPIFYIEIEGKRTACLSEYIKVINPNN